MGGPALMRYTGALNLVARRVSLQNPAQLLEALSRKGTIDIDVVTVLGVFHLISIVELPLKFHLEYAPRAKMVPDLSE